MTVIHFCKHGENLLNLKWLNIKEGIANKKLTNYSNTMELKNPGKFLCKIKCEWETKQKKCIIRANRRHNIL
jgi:hypothetical protein